MLLLPATRLNSNRTRHKSSLRSTAFADKFARAVCVLRCHSGVRILSLPSLFSSTAAGCTPRSAAHGVSLAGISSPKPPPWPRARAGCFPTVRGHRQRFARFCVFSCRDLMTVKTLSQQSFGCVCRRRVAPRSLHPISEGTIARIGTVLAWSTRTDQARETPWGGGTPVGKTAWHRERHVVTDICV